MRVYHGTNCRFERVDMSKSKDKRDFGKGFYTTTIKEQAESWAQAVFDRYGGAGRFVYEFEFETHNSLNIKRFLEANREWLEFVAANRIKGGVWHGFDVVTGPVANDKTNRTIALYMAGIYTADMALELLRHNKLNDQVSFHTEKALSFLTMVGREKNVR
jgi:hypothetical protein